MEDQVENSHLLQMPPLVINKILCNVLNLTNVSCTCNALYDSVCQMETRKRVIRIRRRDPTEDDYQRLTIDDDVVFDSIMNSLRTITNIQLNAHDYPFPYVKLNERQLERLTSIMKHFGANITSLKLSGIDVSTDKIIELLNKAPKLESLEFAYGNAFGSVTTTLNLSSLKKLSIRNYLGLLEIVDSLPSESLDEFFGLGNRQQEVQTILSKQHNLKSLKIDDLSDPVVLCVNHLQLEKLELVRYHNDDQLVEILKCQYNLKELRIWIDCVNQLQPRAFEWICENLKELEVLRVAENSRGKNVYSMLGKLKKLRYFSTREMHFPFGDKNKNQFRNDSLVKLQIDDFSWSSNEELNKMLQSMVRTFTNLTALDLQLQDFSNMNAVLSRCTKLIHLKSRIRFPGPHHDFAKKRFPNIRHLTITISDDYADMQLSFITSIVRAMPNLKSLLMPNTYMKCNVNAVKEFILASKSLEELKVQCFELDQDLSPIDDFVQTIRRLSDQLKAYRLRFKSYDVPALKDILSEEFDDRGGKSKIVLCKGVLKEFHGYH